MLVGQNQLFEDLTLGSGNFRWPVLTVFWVYFFISDEMVNQCIITNNENLSLFVAILKKTKQSEEQNCDKPVNLIKSKSESALMTKCVHIQRIWLAYSQCTSTDIDIQVKTCYKFGLLSA